MRSALGHRHGRGADLRGVEIHQRTEVLGIDVVGGDMLALAGFFLVMLAVAVKRFRREIA